MRLLLSLEADNGAIAEITTALSQARVLMLTTLETDQAVFDAVEAGARAYLLKHVTEAEVLETILAASRGDARPAPKDVDVALNDKEARILQLIADGLTNKQIASAIFLAEGTVKNYVSRIMSKLQASSRTALAVMAIRRQRAE